MRRLKPDPVPDELIHKILRAGIAAANGGTVFVPLKPDDPLYVEGSSTNFMVLSRAVNSRGPGPDGVADLPQPPAGQRQPGEGAESGSVLQVLQKGYRLGDKVLRPARVIVAE